jgi:hypothetical protein
LQRLKYARQQSGAFALWWASGVFAVESVRIGQHGAKEWRGLFPGMFPGFDVAVYDS